jgi:hypothetical protein
LAERTNRRTRLVISMAQGLSYRICVQLMKLRFSVSKNRAPLVRQHSWGSGESARSIGSGRHRGPTCYAVGPREVGEYRFGQITCAGDFPSAEKPILDFSIVHIDLSGRAGITRAEGIAADGISEVAFRSPAGSLVGAMRVRDNIYSGHAIAAAVSGIVAVDRSGRVAYETSVGRAAPAGGTLP